jgi:AAA ATPase domain
VRSVSDAALVGRDEFLTQLAAAARDAAAGQGAVFLLEGEAGIGKTSVARRAGEAAAGSGLAVSWGKCSPDGSAPPFSPWARLVDAALVSTGDSRPVSAEAIGAPRFELLSGLRDHIHRTAAAMPTLHVIEDVQWADVASMLLLGHAAASALSIRITRPTRSGATTGLSPLRGRNRVICAQLRGAQGSVSWPTEILPKILRAPRATCPRHRARIRPIR